MFVFSVARAFQGVNDGFGATVPVLPIVIATVALFLFSSCVELSPEEDQTINIVYDPCDRTLVQAAPNTTSVELAAIDEAIALWQEVANVKMSRDRISADQTLDVRFENAALVFRGLYEDEIGDVVVNRRLSDPDERAITVAHEFGHALGLPHVETRPSIMNSGNLELRPLEGDVDALSELWGPCVRDDNGPQSTPRLPASAAR